MYIAQQAFTTGEISPEVLARSELDKYQYALKQARNVYIRPYGAVYRRSGTIYHSACKYADKKAILVEFNYSVELSYMLEIGEGYIRVHKNGEYLEVNTADNKTYISKYVVASIGKMGRPNKPDYAIPASLNNVVNFNIYKCKENEKVLVVVGGNSAEEYAYLLWKDNDVTINYRKSEFTRPNEKNLETIKEDIASGKVKAKLGIDITSIEDKGGKVLVHYTDGTEDTYDRVIYALGGVAPVDFLKRCDINLDEHGVPIVKDNHESSVENLYIAGDILYKSGGSIAKALNAGFDIVKHVHELMNK